MKDPFTHLSPRIHSRRGRFQWPNLLVLVAWIFCFMASPTRLIPDCDAQVMGGSAGQRMARPAPFDENANAYSCTDATGVAARIQTQLERGELLLRHDPQHGYLTSLLDALSIPLSSQILTFAKTSAQREQTSPKTPRAIYFNDSAFVAWTPESSRLEIAAADPRLGAVFYTLDQDPRALIRLSRNDRCLECHTSAKNLNVPGFLVRSVETDAQGVPDLNTGTSYVTHRSPIEQRWGGWYVCGLHGIQTHLGNLTSPADLERHQKDPRFHGNLTQLSNLFDISRYPTSTSDIVALLVFEHQCHMHNFITRLREESVNALDKEQAIGDHPRLRGIADRFLKYLLFIEEAPLVSPVRGVSDFTAWFEGQGPRDSQGRSLRQFDLQTRLFKYPCSYLIYSPEFESIPRTTKLHLYRRLWTILAGEDQDPAFQKLPEETRLAIREILTETKRNLPLYWTL